MLFYLLTLYRAADSTNQLLKKNWNCALLIEFGSSLSIVCGPIIM